MTTRSASEQQPGATAPNRARRVARVITEVLAPAPTVTLLLLVVAWHSAPTLLDALRWSLVAVAFVTVIPLTYLALGIRRRRVTDLHVRLRQQRHLPLLVALGSVLVAVLALGVADAPRDLVALVAAMAVGLLSSSAITWFWKISVHAAVSAGAVVVLVLVFGPPLLVLAPAPLLAAWSRVELGDHTPTQAALGAVLGASVAGVVFSFFS